MFDRRNRRIGTMRFDLHPLRRHAARTLRERTDTSPVDAAHSSGSPTRIADFECATVSRARHSMSLSTLARSISAPRPVTRRGWHRVHCATPQLPPPSDGVATVVTVGAVGHVRSEPPRTGRPTSVEELAGSHLHPSPEAARRLEDDVPAAAHYPWTCRNSVPVSPVSIRRRVVGASPCPAPPRGPNGRAIGWPRA